MYFEEYHGFRPGSYLHHPRVDTFLATNLIEPQSWEVSAVLSSGLRLSMIRIMLAAVLSIFVGLLHRFVPTYTGGPRVVSYAMQPPRQGDRLPDYQGVWGFSAREGSRLLVVKKTGKERKRSCRSSAVQCSFGRSPPVLPVRQPSCPADCASDGTLCSDAHHSQVSRTHLMVDVLRMATRQVCP
jgi:hypothetical protein